MKMYKTVFFFCFTSYFYIGSTASVPFITKCKAADAKCLKSSSNAVVPLFIKGLKEYGVEPLESFTIKDDIDSSTPGLKFLLKNMKVDGLKSCTIESIYRDVAKSKLGGKILCTVLTRGQYEMNGRLLVINVKGKGNISVLLNKILITIDVDVGEKLGKDGVKYWDLKRFQHSFELLDKSELDFQNLKTGSDVLDRAANEVISNNSNDVVVEIGPPVVRAIIRRVIENVRRFFHRIPSADLALD